MRHAYPPTIADVDLCYKHFKRPMPEGHPAAAYSFFLVYLWICKIKTGLPPMKRLGNCGVYLKSKVCKYKTRVTKQLWSACITINDKFCTTDSLP